MKFFATIVLALALFGALAAAYPQSLGGSLSSNPNGGADARLELTKGIGSSDPNVIGKVHGVDANVFASQNKLANVLKFDRNEAGLEFSHINGHGASLTQSNIPNLGQQLNFDAKSNLWSSPKLSAELEAAQSG